MRFAATARRVAAAAAAALPGVRVELAYLDLNEPLIDDALNALAHEAGDGLDVVVVPLLFGDGFHSKKDLPEILSGARARNPGLRTVQTPVIGRCSPVPALVDRLAEAGFPRSPRPGDGSAFPCSFQPEDATALPRSPSRAGNEPESKGPGVLLYAVGSSDPGSDASIRERGRELSGVLGVPVETVFATRLGPEGAAIRRAVERLRAAGATRIAASPLFLSAGLLTDRTERVLDEVVPGALVAGPIGAHPVLVDAIARLYHSTVAAPVG
ncbi:MAG: CbiX/SirB N-terminal domain-containing protein [Gordonia sp. (in: high G+C Gram-positive bacteria)]|uniref:sirohydrochlorin chelatase n=1 Tax=Gordonia sp. (in: high G+C Gram-positive bacteria) TaxID=84139 RepID=UPI0039E3BB2C